MTNNKVEMKLQGHEKFTIREGWINKALILLPEYPDAFTRKDATDLFGIGSNMVKSLRYWMRAFGLTNKAGSELSDVGKIIAENDPYLEYPFSLWLMHSNIAKNIGFATTWYMYFNRCNADDLEKQDIENIILREITKYSSGSKFSEKSLKSDVDVLLNMYSKDKEQIDPEEKSISPFAQLSLIKKHDGRFIKTQPNRKLLPDAVILYELSTIMNNRKSVSIDEIVNGENGLSKIYNMTYLIANEYLDRLDASGLIRVNRTAGLDMVYPTIELNPKEIILTYYKNN